MSNYISINIVSETLITLNSIKSNCCYNFKDIISLHLPYGVRPDISIEFAKQCAWITEGDGFFVLTEAGNDIISEFNGTCINTGLWKKILASYINVCRPAWARRIPFGRKEAYLFMNEEEKKCFDDAGLIDSYDMDTVRWWDSFAEEERRIADKIKDEVGREGERQTLCFEEKRTGIRPEWHSIESNLSGYDILSVKSSENPSRLLIEVKASSCGINQAEAHISRNEWDIACMQNNKERYLFYFWLINNQKTGKLAIIRVCELEKYIPEDKALGKWELMNVPFAAFAEKFSCVDLYQKEV